MDTHFLDVYNKKKKAALLYDTPSVLIPPHSKIHPLVTPYFILLLLITQNGPYGLPLNQTFFLELTKLYTLENFTKLNKNECRMYVEMYVEST